MDKVIVLNYDYTFLNLISWKKAIRLITKGKAEVIKNTETLVHTVNQNLQFVVPKILRLVKFVQAIYKHKIPFSKKHVMCRDQYVCQYCEKLRTKLTIDHVIPKSLGGKSTFENCVTACVDCNHKKANRTLEQSKMTLRRKPYQPTIMEFLQIKMKTLNIKLEKTVS